MPFYRDVETFYGQCRCYTKLTNSGRVDFVKFEQFVANV
jgi:hypothetical protein